MSSKSKSKNVFFCQNQNEKTFFPVKIKSKKRFFSLKKFFSVKIIIKKHKMSSESKSKNMLFRHSGHTVIFKVPASRTGSRRSLDPKDYYH